MELLVANNVVFIFCTVKFVFVDDVKDDAIIGDVKAVESFT